MSSYRGGLGQSCEGDYNNMDRMIRTLSVITLLALALALVAQTPKKSALDKGTMEAYVRHLFVMDSRVKIEVSDPKPSDLPGFLQETVHASAGTQAQDFTFYVSQDGSRILQGNVFDVNN